MTTIQSELAARMPSTTAPPSPPTGVSRCSTVTGYGQSRAASRITSGVSSVESSTKTTSQGSREGTDSVIRCSSSRMFADSLKVGTTMVTAPGSGTAEAARSAGSPNSPGTVDSYVIGRLRRSPRRRCRPCPSCLPCCRP